VDGMARKMSTTEPVLKTSLSSSLNFTLFNWRSTNEKTQSGNIWSEYLLVAHSSYTLILIAFLKAVVEI
jgi:hypothetical protein